MVEPIGFIGLGVMGQPMAANLARAGVPVVAWNRSPERSTLISELGGLVAGSIDEVFARSATVVMMLVNEAATDAVLGRGTDDFATRVTGHLIISTGSVSPEYSRRLHADVRSAGGRFVESPVSGSRGPAGAGTLVALLGGEPDDIDDARTVLAPMTKAIIACGPAGAGLTMKLAVNHYLNVMLAALAESVHFADAHNLPRQLMQEAIMVGPMASELTGIKLAQLVANDYDTRAAVSDAYASTRLISDAARAAEVASPLLDVASDLYREAAAVDGRKDMITVITSIENRTRFTQKPDTQ